MIRFERAPLIDYKLIDSGTVVDPVLCEVDNVNMSASSIAATTATLGFLTSEAELALQEAKRLREQLAALPEGDPKRAFLERAIQDLLDRSRRFSTVVTSTAASS